jgi:peptidoglycan/LPS O-acetylase OafA/YrhL
MRAVAAGSIVLFHIWRYASPEGAGFDLGLLDHVFQHLPVGVTLFFTLSGFLLYRPFAGAIMRGHEHPTLRAYFRNRALRILPAYWVILILAGVVLQATFVRPSALELGIGPLFTDPWVLIRNATLTQNYTPGTLLTGIGPAWSLAIELVFYLVLPLVAFIGSFAAARSLTRRGRRLAAFAPPLILFFLGMSGKAVAAFVVPGLGPGAGWVGDWHSVIERSFWGQADLFVFGMALAVARVDAEDGLLRLPRWWMGVVAAGVVLVAVPAAALADMEMLGAYPYDTLMALACGLLLSLVVLPDVTRTDPSSTEPRLSLLVRMLESRVLVLTGLVSYSLFLWHEPLIRWMQVHGFTVGGRTGFLVDIVLLGSISLVLAALTYRFVERPALARKRRQTRQIQHQPAGAAPTPSELEGVASGTASGD